MSGRDQGPLAGGAGQAVSAPAFGRATIGAATAGLLVILWYVVASPPTVVVGAVAVGVVGALGIAWEWWCGRLFSLSALVYMAFLTTWSMRPLYLFAHRDELGSYRGPRSALEFLTQLRTQELAEFVTFRYPGRPEDLLAGAQLIGCVFVAGFVIARCLAGRAVSPRDPGWQLFPVTPRREVLTVIIVLFVVLGLAGQAAIIQGAGGLGSALAHLEDQANLRLPYAYYVMVGFGTIAAVLWAAYGDLGGHRRLLFMALVGEALIFAAITGSRSRMLMPILLLTVTIHLARRRLRRREVLAAALALLTLATVVLSVRQASAGRPLGDALADGAGSAISLRIAVNDSSQFDTVATLVGVVPAIIPHQGGQRLIDGVVSALPRQIVPTKPPPGDVWFKEQVWGKARPAGRPYTFPGELWLDFGLIGVAIGALGFGALAGRYRGTGRDGALDPGLAVTSAVVVVVLSGMMDGVYSTTITFGLELIVPLLFARVLVGVLSRRHDLTRQAGVHGVGTTG